MVESGAQPQFSVSMQCSISALYALEARTSIDAETPRVAAVRRLFALCQQATAELERHLANGSSGVSLAAEPRMSYCEDAAIVPLMTSVNYSNSMNHRQQVWNIIERWNAECEKSPAGPPEEQKVSCHQLTIQIFCHMQSCFLLFAFHESSFSVVGRVRGQLSMFRVS